MAITFTLTSDYPERIPTFSVSSTYINRDIAHELISQLSTFAQNLVGNSMMMDLLMWIQENCSNLVNRITERVVSAKDDGCDSMTTLLQLDHMRSRGKYIKTIRKWTEELNLCGCLLFFGRFIFIILQGCQKDTKG